MPDQIHDINQWIKKGDNDLGAAKVILANAPEYYEATAFHCQQAVEKYLKAYLLFLNINFRFTHDLIYLLELISTIDNSFEAFIDDLAELQAYAVEVRYPNETYDISSEDMEKAVRIADTVRKEIIAKLKI